MWAVLTRASTITRRTRCISQPAQSRRRPSMQHEDSFTASIAHLIERAVRCERKTGEGKVPTQTIASILGLPDEPIFSETGVEGIATRISPNPLQSDWQLWKSQGMSIRVEFPTPAHLHSLTRRTRATVENSFTAVQHLTKPLFLSKPAEPPLSENV